MSKPVVLVTRTFSFSLCPSAFAVLMLYRAAKQVNLDVDYKRVASRQQKKANPMLLALLLDNPP